MGGAPGTGLLAGRESELARTVGVLNDAIAGRFGALLISGESGIGKTELVRAAAASCSGSVDLLWAPCLPLTRLRSSFQPLRSAVRDWEIRTAQQGPGADLWSGDEASKEDPAERFDAWLSGVPSGVPLVLVVDDLQWADRGTLDLVMYLLAGPRQRRTAVVSTCRTGVDGSAEGGEVLTRWLADVQRLPSVGAIQLRRLDRFATHQQMAQVMKAEPRELLVDDVFRRTAGNPYWTRLIVEGLSVDATSVPENLSQELSQAVTRPYTRLSDEARRMTGVMAVGGGPLDAHDIGELIQQDPDTVAGLLREAFDAGVLVPQVGGAYWFSHPLLPQVLASGLLPEERDLMHREYIRVLEPAINTDPAFPRDRDRAARIAFHHRSTGNTAEAARWSLEAAGLAEREERFAEAVVELRQTLHADIVRDASSRRVLVDRIRVAANAAGDLEEELRAVKELLSTTDPGVSPLEFTRLTARRVQLSFVTGREIVDIAEARRVVDAAAIQPSSPEYALAVALLADALVQHGDPAGPETAGHAVELARAAGSPQPLAYALAAQGSSIAFLVDGGDNSLPAREASRLALEVRDWWTYLRGVAGTAYSRGCDASWAHLLELRQGRKVMVAAGAPHSFQAVLSAWEADTLLLLGQWHEALERVRTALTYSPGRGADVYARLVLTQLACRQGRLTEAENHLRRAEELVPEAARKWHWRFEVASAELAVARNDLEGAMSRVPASPEDRMPDTVERLMPLAAQALADRLRTLRDHGESTESVLERMRDLRDRFPRVLFEVQLGPAWQVQVDAMQAWYDAECARAEAADMEGALWLVCVEAFVVASLPWDEAYARYRAAAALLKHPSTRSAGTAQLRRGLALAHDLEANPIRQELEQLAKAARIPIDSPASGEEINQTDAFTVTNASLTPREKEILGHIVAGRTYAEIARELVISEKTVSVHVSNLLRKTGTTGRLELAQLVLRTRRTHRSDLDD